MEATTHGGHVLAISSAVPLRMEGSVEPEHSRSALATSLTSRSMRAPRPDVGEEVVTFVIDQDESREVLHVDLPDGFHT